MFHFKVSLTKEIFRKALVDMSDDDLRAVLEMVISEQDLRSDSRSEPSPLTDEEKDMVKRGLIVGTVIAFRERNCVSLVQAKEAVDRYRFGGEKGQDLPPLTDEEKEMVDRGMIPDAARTYRDRNGVGLVLAKEAIDSYRYGEKV